MANLTIRASDRVYSDFDLTFRANPVTGDVSIKKDVEAVKQSVLNILLTNRGEKPFEPAFGSGIRAYLFENFDDVTAALIEEDIIFSLSNYEPRITIDNISVTGTADLNAVDITLEFTIKSPSAETATLQFTVERLR